MQPELFTHFDSSASPRKGQGALAGKSVVVQPNWSVRGWPCEAGSMALRGFVALEDATVVERIREAGGALTGSVRMSELGLGLAGDTTGRVLSEGLADLALMTDMMGEARITAARSGYFAFKPSHGRVSRFGLIGLAPSLEACGLLARNIRDLAVVLGVIAGDDGRDFTLADGGAPATDIGAAGTVGVVTQCLGDLHASQAGALRAGLGRLEAAGCRIVEVGLPDTDLFRAVHQCVGAVEASSSCGKYDGVRYGHRTASAKNWNEMYLKTRGECFGPLVKAYLFQGAYFQFENYGAFENACRLRARLAEDMRQLFGQVDALACPTRRNGDSGTPPENLDALYADFMRTLPANVTGGPAVQIPRFCTADGVDYGLQLWGPRLGDEALLSLALRLSGPSQGV